MRCAPDVSCCAALLGALVACGERPAVVSDSNVKAFALVQERGQVAMGVDQYTSSHRFETLPDGGRITLQRDPNDAVGVKQIRKHMQEIAASFRSGNFAVPGFVHDREVPGTEVMSARRFLISYTAESTAGGGQLRIRSRDSAAIAAIHDFLAFQRRDHRAGHDGESH